MNAFPNKTKAGNSKPVRISCAFNLPHRWPWPSAGTRDVICAWRRRGPTLRLQFKWLGFRGLRRARHCPNTHTPRVRMRTMWILRVFPLPFTIQRTLCVQDLVGLRLDYDALVHRWHLLVGYCQRCGDDLHSNLWVVCNKGYVHFCPYREPNYCHWRCSIRVLQKDGKSRPVVVVGAYGTDATDEYRYYVVAGVGLVLNNPNHAWQYLGDSDWGIRPSIWKMSHGVRGQQMPTRYYYKNKIITTSWKPSPLL